MTKENTTKIVLIAGGAALIGYMMVNQGVADKIKNALAGLGTGGGGLGFGDITWPSINLPAFNLSLPQNALDACGLGDLFASMTNKGTGGGSNNLPPGGATVTDVVYTMPSWAKGVIGVSAGLLGGYGGYKVIQASAPFLKALGNQAAKATGGIGGFFRNIFSKIPNAPMPTGPFLMSPIMPVLYAAQEPHIVGFLGGIDTAIHNALGIAPDQPTPAQGGSPVTVAPSLIATSWGATKTTALMDMPQFTGWPGGVARLATPSITVAGKTYGFFTAPGAPAPPQFTPA